MRSTAEQALHLGLATIERDTLVDVALVGDLVPVDRGHVRQEQYARDAHGSAGIDLVPLHERVAQMRVHHRMACVEGKVAVLAGHLLAACGVEPRYQTDLIAP